MEAIFFSRFSTTSISIVNSHRHRSPLIANPNKRPHLKIRRVVDKERSQFGSVSSIGDSKRFRFQYTTVYVGPDGGAAASDLSSDVITLNVGGMTCGGCSASVKKILESQTQVSSASVNLTTGTAIIWPSSEATVASNWRKYVGEALAKHLTNCGFESNLQEIGG